MGASQSLEMNITMMSSIVQASILDIENTLLYLEERPRILTSIEKLYFDRVKEKERVKLEAIKAQQEYLESLEANNERKSPTASNIKPSASSSPSPGSPSQSVTSSLVTSPAGKTTQTSPFALGKHELETFEKEIVEEIVDPSIYIFTPVRLRELLDELNYHPADVDTLCDLYCLADSRGFEDTDIRTVLISFSILLATSCRDYIEIVFRLYDRTPTHLISKKDLFDIVALANDTLMYFGDRSLKTEQVADFADSIFTSAGQIDGEIYYKDYFDTMANHPIIEMMLSPQFQGRLRDKLLDEATLATADMTVR